MKYECGKIAAKYLRNVKSFEALGNCLNEFSRNGSFSDYLKNAKVAPEYKSMILLTKITTTILAYQPLYISSKSTIETPGQCARSVQS